MGSFIGSVVLHTTDSERGVAFWQHALGATRVEWDYPEDADHVVLADPDGNLFCVVA